MDSRGDTFFADNKILAPDRAASQRTRHEVAPIHCSATELRELLDLAENLRSRLLAVLVKVNSAQTNLETAQDSPKTPLPSAGELQLLRTETTDLHARITTALTGANNTFLRVRTSGVDNKQESITAKQYEELIKNLRSMDGALVKLVNQLCPPPRKKPVAFPCTRATA